MMEELFRMAAEIEHKEMLKQAKRDEVKLRDGARCRYLYANGHRCSQMRYLQIHHVIPKAQGGSDDMENLTLLCPQHHRLIHLEAGWRWDATRKRFLAPPKSAQGSLSF
jgi:5-methylcytosine-specific restriction endonuclease McrA